MSYTLMDMFIHGNFFQLKIVKYTPYSLFFKNYLHLFLNKKVENFVYFSLSRVGVKCTSQIISGCLYVYVICKIYKHNIHTTKCTTLFSNLQSWHLHIFQNLKALIALKSELYYSNNNWF